MPGDLWRYFSAGKQATWTQNHPGFHSKNFWLSLINWPIMSYFMSYDMDTTWCPATSNKNCGLALGFLTASCGESLDVSVRFEISPWERWLAVFCRVFEQLIIYQSQIDLFIHSPAPQSSSKSCSLTPDPGYHGLKWTVLPSLLVAKVRSCCVSGFRFTTGFREIRSCTWYMYKSLIVFYVLCKKFLFYNL